MKINFLKIIFVLAPLLSFGQEQNKKENYFIALYTVGDGWDINKQPNEQPYFKEHSNHLDQLRKDNTIVIGARYSDTGMIVIKATDFDMAKNILLNDIAVKNNLFHVEIQPFSPFYKGCLE
ncbi:YciI family protein [Maribacter sp. 2210JD10-5]|uniref:YciI family protein n=1 Tax=Maribacter sp. 2210JD10-5 TaxID=3386272 RepID=UPI0039BCF99C